MKFADAFSLIRKVSGAVCMILSIASVLHAQTPSDGQSKTKFADKIGHWLYAYGMSSPDFLAGDRAAFKEKAFAEVYVEATIAYDAWMFNLLNKVTRFRYPAKQMPHIVFEVKFTPTDETLTKYNIGFDIQATGEVTVNLQNIAKEAASTLGGQTYAEPALAVADVEKAIKAALTTLASKLGNELAPNLLVRYADEVFWNGHEIPVMEGEGDYVELEAVDKTGTPISPSLLTWTNADPFESKGVVNMTGVNSKEVMLVKTGEEKNLVVMLKRVGTSDDINELLKMLIVEVLTQKKKEAQDTIVILKTDSTNNAREVSAQIALLERDNLQMEDDGQRYSPLFSTPQVLQDESYFNADNQRVHGFELLRKRKALNNTIRRKVNVVAFADLVVDKPEKVKELLDELLRSSGRLIARVIMNKDSKGQRDEARNIVIEFFNNNLEKIADNQYPESLTLEQPLPPVVITATQPQYQSGQLLYVSPHVSFDGKQDFVSELSTYLSQINTAPFVVINYSQDLSTTSALLRSTKTRPKGLSDNMRYLAITLVNIPGSVKLQLLGSGLSMQTNASSELKDLLINYIKSNIATEFASEPSDQWEDISLEDPVEYVYCFTPAGKIFALPPEARLNFVNNTAIPIPQGALVSYELNRKEFFAHYEKRNGQWYFVGYFEGKEDNKRGTKGYSYVTKEQLEVQLASSDINITTASLASTLVIPLEEEALKQWIARLGIDAAKNVKSVGRFTVVTIAAGVVLELFATGSHLEYGEGVVVTVLPLPSAIITVSWELPDGMPTNLPIIAPISFPHKLPKDKGNCSVYVIFRFDKITGDISVAKYGMTCQTVSDGTQCDDRPNSQCRVFNTDPDPIYNNTQFRYHWTWVPYARNISSSTARIVEKSLTGAYILVNGGALPPLHERPCFKRVTDFTDVTQIAERLNRVREWFNQMKQQYGQ